MGSISARVHQLVSEPYDLSRSSPAKNTSSDLPSYWRSSSSEVKERRQPPNPSPRPPKEGAIGVSVFPYYSNKISEKSSPNHRIPSASFRIRSEIKNSSEEFLHHPRPDPDHHWIQPPRSEFRRSPDRFNPQHRSEFRMVTERLQRSDPYHHCLQAWDSYKEDLKQAASNLEEGGASQVRDPHQIKVSRSSNMRLQQSKGEVSSMKQSPRSHHHQQFEEEMLEVLEEKLGVVESYVNLLPDLLQQMKNLNLQFSKLNDKTSTTPSPSQHHLEEWARGRGAVSMDHTLFDLVEDEIKSDVEPIVDDEEYKSLQQGYKEEAEPSPNSPVQLPSITVNSINHQLPTSQRNQTTYSSQPKLTANPPNLLKPSKQGISIMKMLGIYSEHPLKIKAPKLPTRQAFQQLINGQIYNVFKGINDNYISNWWPTMELVTLTMNPRPSPKPPPDTPPSPLPLSLAFLPSPLYLLSNNPQMNSPPLQKNSPYISSNLHFTTNKPKGNPDFFNCNKVNIRYGNGASFSGEGYKAAGLYFRGQRIWLAAIEDPMSKEMCNGHIKVKCIADVGLLLDAVEVASGHTIRTFVGGTEAYAGEVGKIAPNTLSSHQPNPRPPPKPPPKPPPWAPHNSPLKLQEDHLWQFFKQGVRAANLSTKDQRIYRISTFKQAWKIQKNPLLHSNKQFEGVLPVGTKLIKSQRQQWGHSQLVCNMANRIQRKEKTVMSITSNKWSAQPTKAINQKNARQISFTIKGATNVQHWTVIGEPHNSYFQHQEPNNSSTASKFRQSPTSKRKTLFKKRTPFILQEDQRKTSTWEHKFQEETKRGKSNRWSMRLLNFSARSRVEIEFKEDDLIDAYLDCPISFFITNRKREGG